MRGDREIDLEYTVIVRTYGKPRKLRQEVGKRLAKACGLNFYSFEVTSGKSQFKWSTMDHDGGLVGEA